MTPRLSHLQGESLQLWGRVVGEWGPAECGQLGAWLQETPIPRGSRVILDFSETRHMHFKSAPRLLQIAQDLEERGATLCITGLSDYLRHIVEVACALEGRDFIEQHGLGRSPLPGPADPRAIPPLPGEWGPWDPHGLVVPSMN